MAAGRQWKRGHAARGVGGYNRAEDPGQVLPSPGFDDDPGADEDVDLGDIYPADIPDEPIPADRGRAPFFPDLSEVIADPRPAPVGKSGGAGRARGRATAKVAKATRDDIEGKLGLMLEIPGRIWEARDPLCGGAFVAQAPAIRAAALELVLLSPDLVAWFTGVGGGFMLWLNLLMACQPVAVMVWAHHIAHSVELPEGAAPGTRQYAA